MTDGIENIGAGSITTVLPAGQTGPTDANGKPVLPRVTSDFTGPVSSNSTFTSIIYPQYNDFSGVFTTDPLTMQTQAHGLDLDYSNTPIVTPTSYNYPYAPDLTVGLDGLNASGTKLASYGDWDATADWDGQMRVTMAEGMPFVYVSRTGSTSDALVTLHQQSTASKGSPINPLTYTASGLNGAFNGNKLAFNVPVDAGSDVADGVQARVTYDFNGDGTPDRVETYNWFATDASPGNESYNQGQGLTSVTGGPMQDMNGGSVKVEMWQANGTGNVSVATNRASSYIALPYSNLTTPAGSSTSGNLYLQGGAVPGGQQSALALTPGSTPGKDNTQLAPAASLPGYSGPGQVWYNHNGVVGLTINGKSYGLFAPPGSTWTYTSQGLESDLGGGSDYSVAVLPDAKVSTLMYFRQHAYAFVTGTTSNYSVDKDAGTVTTTLTASTRMVAQGDDLSSDPLMAEYPHQYLNSSTPLSGMSYASARGTIQLIAGGNSFTTTMQMNPLLPVLPFMGTDAQKAQLQGMLHDELKTFLSPGGDPLDKPGDTYWKSRQEAKFADMAELAEEVGYGQARDVFIKAVESSLDSWFNATDGDGSEFYYDKDWNTLIGYPASYDSDDKLNDHHFHYGYLINAAATVAQFDPQWASQSQYGGMVDQLVDDVANSDRSNTQYPYLRNFDPYKGYSLADGTGQGNNEESASESLNFASSVARWGAVTGQGDIEDTGLYLQTTETQTMDQYWYNLDHLSFPAGYTPPVDGRVFDNGGDYATFFGTDPNWVQGIDYTPINGGSLFYAEHPELIRQDLQYLSTQNGGQGPTDWKLGFWMVQALVDPDAALAAYNADPTWQEGGGEESKVYTLNWLESLQSLGTLDTTTTANSPYAAVFDDGGVKSYVGFNPSSSAGTITFSDGTVIQLAADNVVTMTGGTVVNTLDYSNNDIPQRPDGIPADLPTDPPQHPLDVISTNGNLTLSVEKTTGTAWVTVGNNQPIAVLQNGQRVDVQMNANTTLIGIGRDSSGAISLLGETSGGEPYYPYRLDSNMEIMGNGGALYNANWRTLEPEYGIDFNDDGIVVAGPLKVIAQNGSLTLYEDTGNGLAYVQNGSNPMMEVHRNAGGSPTPVTQGAYSLSAIGVDENGNVTLLDTAGPTSTASYAWTLDAKGNWTGETVYQPSDISSAEAIFQQDLNGDGTIPAPLDQVVAHDGSLELLVDPTTGDAVVQLENGTRETVTRGGSPVLLHHGSQITAIGRDAQGRLRVLDGSPTDWSASSTHWSWILNPDGSYRDQDVISGTNLPSIEGMYNKDLNDDGVVTGSLKTVVDRNDGDTLSFDDATGFAYVAINGGPATVVTRDGSQWGGDVALQQSGGWNLSSVATDSQGRTRVLDTNPNSNMWYAWILDANNHWYGEQSFNSSTVGQAEVLFNKDLDGNGSVGNGATVMAAKHPTFGA
ncbi:MAG: glycosyl hydrolase [Janthinobacterium lividum]